MSHRYAHAHPAEVRALAISLRPECAALWSEDRATLRVEEGK